jgi:Lon protease-like protein
MFPLSTVLFPAAGLSLHVFEPRYRQLTVDCLRGDRELGVVLIRRGSEVGGGDERVDVGTVARIETATPLADGRWRLAIIGAHRLRVREWLADDPYPLATVDDLPDDATAPDAAAVARTETAVRRVRALLSELGQQPALVGPLDGGVDGRVAADDGQSARSAAWRLCGLAPVTPFDGQRLLEIDGPEERLAVLAELADATADDLTRLLAGG